MVAALVRLRLQVLANSLKRSTWQLIATVIGALYGLGVLVVVVGGLVVLGLFSTLDLATTVVVIAGSAVTAGWIILPLVLTGIDQTLEPAKLAQFPIPLRTLLIGLTITGVLGVPGLITTIAGLATVFAWIRYPLAAATAAVCAIIGVLIAIVASRAVTAASVGMQSSRRARELSGILILVPLFLLGPILIGVMQGLRESSDVLPQVAAALGWSPLGAAWAAPAAVAAGDGLGAAVRVLIALATLAVLVAVWRFALARALVTPAVESTRAVSRGALGAFGWVPQTPAGAVMARCLTYWRRDPRYARQLIIVPLIPVLLWFYSAFGSGSNALLMWSGPLVGFSLALTLATDISYDGTAFATHVIDGVRGRDDRLGRLGALALFAVPATIAIALGGVGLSDQWSHAASILALSLGALLTGFGVVCVSSARFVMPVPQAGDNPFKSAPGTTITTGLQLFVVWGVVLALLLPTAALVVASFVSGNAVFGWLSLACALITGLVVTVLGIRLGGALLDRTGPVLLGQLRRLRGA